MHNSKTTKCNKHFENEKHNFLRWISCSQSINKRESENNHYMLNLYPNLKKKKNKLKKRNDRFPNTIFNVVRSTFCIKMCSTLNSGLFLSLGIDIEDNQQQPKKPRERETSTDGSAVLRMMMAFKDRIVDADEHYQCYKQQEEDIEPQNTNTAS